MCVHKDHIKKLIGYIFILWRKMCRWKKWFGVPQTLTYLFISGSTKMRSIKFNRLQKVRKPYSKLWKPSSQHMRRRFLDIYIVPGFQNNIGSESGFQNLVGSGSSLNIKMWSASKIELFLQYVLTKFIIHYNYINYINFMSKG